VVPLIFRRELMFPKLLKWQPYIFGIGVSGISVFMMGAGILGVPRRHWDMTFSDSVFSFDFPATAFLMMGLNGMFAILAAAGGAIYILVVVLSILFGKRRDEAAAKEAPMLTPAVATYGSAGTWHLPGTYVLVAIFFTAFVLYYFINWKFLSEVWPLS